MSSCLLGGAAFKCAARCSIAITDSGGAVSSYITFAADQICGAPDNLVAFATFQPFRAALPCRYGLDGFAGTPAPPPFAPDGRCFNGIVSIGNVPDPLLAVSEAGVTRHVEIDGCPSPSTAGSIALQIFTSSPSAAVPVVVGAPVTAPGADQTCLRLDHAFAVAGDYRLHVSFAGADAGNTISPARLFYRFF